MKPCPKCGRPMAEETMFKGLWTCPLYGKLACNGFEITEIGAQAFVDKLILWKKPIEALNEP